MKLILTLATIAALAAASVHAGGPVIVEDTETRAEPRDRKGPPAWVWVILGGAIVAAIADGSDGGSGGSDNPCQGPDDTPTGGEVC
jgi:hypothetical protein